MLKTRTVLTMILIAVLLVGCGGDGDDSASAGVESSESEADLPILDDPVEVVSAHIEEVGLTICYDEPSEPDISGAYGGHYWGVGDPRCDGDYTEAGGINLRLYNDEAMAAQQLQTPFGDAYITWLIDPTTVVTLSTVSTPRVVTAMTQVLSDYPSAGPGA